MDPPLVFIGGYFDSDPHLVTDPKPQHIEMFISG